MKPTLKEVKEYFKDAETIKCLTSDEIEPYTPEHGNKVHDWENIWWSDFDDDGEDNSLNLWERGIGFAKIITYKHKQMKTLNREDYKRIYDIACGDWKPKLQEWYGNKFAIEDEINIKDSEYKLMRKACTPKQHTLFDDIFGADKKDLEIGKWYKVPHTKMLINITNLDGFAYGFTKIGQWRNNEGGWGFDNLEEATEEEVKSALLKEAEKKYGDNTVRCLRVGGYKIDWSRGVWELRDNALCVHSKNRGDGVWLFDNGKWAEIIKDNKPTEKTYKIGQRFKIGSSKLLLSSVDTKQKVNLINIENGARELTEPFTVENLYKITEKEFKDMIIGREFTLYKE